MNVVQITPGAGAMFCGNCFRDNALVKALRDQGHSALMVPLYLPLTLDEDDQSRGLPIFFNGVNVYLEQQFPWFRTAPKWLHKLFASPALLKWASGRAAKTRAADLGEITLSMIRGEEGNQARELVELIAFLKTQPKPDIICLSNVLLVGMARRLKAELGVPIACVLQGEDTFLDALPESHRALTWDTLAERCRDVDLFLPPSHYFAKRMSERLRLPGDKVRVIYAGINLAGFDEMTAEQTRGANSQNPTIGFFARMCQEKGLDTLVDAFIILKERNRIKNLQLKVGGSHGPADEPFVNRLREKLRARSYLEDVSFFPNVDRAGKLDFFKSLTIFSVPALYGEAFGLYVAEAFASGVPVVQPRHAAFPELVELSGGGILCEAGSATALADALESLLLEPARARALGEAGCKAAAQHFDSQKMADETLNAFTNIIKQWQSGASNIKPAFDKISTAFH